MNEQARKYASTPRSSQQEFDLDETRTSLMPGSRDQAPSGDAAARRFGADVTPFRAIAESVSAQGGELVEQVSALIDQAQAFAAAQVNATLTLRNWYIGRLIDVAVLREGRAGHDRQLSPHWGDN